MKFEYFIVQKNKNKKIREPVSLLFRLYVYVLYIIERISKELIRIFYERNAYAFMNLFIMDV